MRLTERDIKLVKDVCLSHVLSRDQIIALGYFSSVCRANARLKELVEACNLASLKTPFNIQHFYIPGKNASDSVGARIGKLLQTRSASPMFLRHALAVTDVRISLLKQGACSWRFEQQLWDRFEDNRRTFQVRPDGFIRRNSIPLFIEVDLGHTAALKFRAKAESFARYESSGRFSALYGEPTFQLLVVTVSRKRAGHLRNLCKNTGLQVEIQTFAELGVELLGGWS